MSPSLHTTRKGFWPSAALALAFSGVLSSRPVGANPLNPVVGRGSASFSTQGPNLTIHTSANTLINWASFNIGAGETTTFIQPSSTSVVWNHISDPNPTQILGHLDANGYVVLQNQAGFYVGGNAVINAAGVLMTTTPVVPHDVFDGGPWQFSAPPPTASIINYGEINAGPAGSVFLISHDVDNEGTINAPGGNIGLCAGEKVMVSTRADGRGFSADVTLPQGSVDNNGKLTADAGTIALNAQVVNQGGLIQANSVRDDNGVIEIVASDSVNLWANSTISAQGDTQGVSAGGQVTIKGGKTFTDTPTSVINVSGGAQGGNGGKVEVSAAEISAIQSQIDGHAGEGWVGGHMTIDPANITIASGSASTSGDGTVLSTTSPGSMLTLGTSYLNGFSQIDLQATGTITLATAWTLPPSTGSATLTLQAGNDIVFGNGDSLIAGNNWTVNLVAGANFLTPTSVTPNFTTKPSAGGSIILNGTAGVQSANGNINLIAGGEIVTGTGSIVSTGIAATGTTAAIGAGSILMQAYAQNIVLSGSQWTLPASSAPASLTLEAGDNIVFSQANGESIAAGQNWSVNMIAGANFSSPTGVTATPSTTPLSDQIVMSGAMTVQTVNGNISLEAGNDIIFGSTPWTLPSSSTPVSLNLEAGNNLVFNNGESLTLGQNWTVNMVAGANFKTPDGVAPNATSGQSSIAISGNTSIQSANGNITLIAGGEISTGSGTIQTSSGTSILLQSYGQEIMLGGSQWNLPDSAAPASVTLQSGQNIVVNGGIQTGQNWALDLVAGATFATPTSVNANSVGSVILGGSILQTENGNINVTAADNVTIGLQNQNGNNVTITPGVGAIRTGLTPLFVDLPGGGGNITVDAVGGSVNTGDNTGGYSFRLGAQYTVPGGISTAAGGNVSITAGGNITSYLPTGTSSSPTDAGSGAFGPEPGVVTVTAGGSVYGHYVAADSVVNGVNTPSTITAVNGNAGSTASTSDYLALSLATGSWLVNAPNGNINLQEVRNSQGTLNAVSYTAGLDNVFNYAPDASVTLNAADSVNLLGQSLPRYSGDLVPCIYPPSLTIDAGTVSLGANVILFPSADGELTVNTTGNFTGNGWTMAMSDFGLTAALTAKGVTADQWTSATDYINGHAPVPIQLNSEQPVVFNIGGDLDDVTLVMPKATEVTVGGNMNNVSFTGQNLQATGPMSTTFFHVAGQVTDQNVYSFVTLATPLTLPAPLFPDGVQNYLQLLQNAIVPGTGPTSTGNGPASPLFPSLDIFYLPQTHQLGYYGTMSAATEAMLLGTLQEITYTPSGHAILNTQGNAYVTATASFAGSPGSPLYQAIQALYAASQNSINPSAAPNGIVIGGPGQLDITAQSMNLGASTQGVSSQGPAVNNSLAQIPGKGAAINITLTGTPTAADPTAGDLDMFASQISSWYGGAIDINVTGAVNAGLGALPLQSPTAPHGIWSSGDSDVSVIAQGDINVEGSRIASFDGGNVFVESAQGNVDAGTGSLSAVLVNEVVINPNTGAITTPQQPIAGSGIMTTTLPDAPKSLEVGNITVDTPHGDIDAGLGGITQEPRNGNTSVTPSIDLTAGDDINASGTGVIGVNVNAKAGGNITGIVISSGNTDLNAGQAINATVLAGGSASFNAGTTISGLAVAGGAINIGSGTFSGVALSQNVSGGGAVSALASAASAVVGSQTSAASEASSQKTATSDQSSAGDGDDLKNHRPRPLLTKYTSRVTVLLPLSTNSTPRL